MKKLLSSLFLTLCIFATAPANAQDTGTAEEAKALVESAIALHGSMDEAAFFEAVTTKDARFVDRDLYIFVMDLEANMLAHAANKGLVGRNIMDLKDPDGKLFIQEFVTKAKNPGEGWVDYKWPNPVTKKVMQKSTFVKKLGANRLVGCGIYK